MDVSIDNQYVKQLPLVFDIDRLVEQVNTIISGNERHFADRGAINIVRPSVVDDHRGLSYGCGSLYDYETSKWIARETDFDTVIKQFRQTYINSVIDQVAEYARDVDQLSIGRVRLMMLRPKSCLTMHTDHGATLRYHVPISTNEHCMFIHNTSVSKMPEAGQLYQFDSSVPHTAINASRIERVHLVMVGYK